MNLARNSRGALRDPGVCETVGFRGLKRWRVEGFRESVGFSVTDLLSIYMGRQFLQLLAGTPFWDGQQKVFSKIRGALGEQAMRYLQKLASSLEPTAVGSSDYRKRWQLIDQLMVCVEDRLISLIVYQSDQATEPVEQELYPQGFVFHRGSLYLIASSSRREAMRTYKMDRIEDVHATNLLSQLFRCHRFCIGIGGQTIGKVHFDGVCGQSSRIIALTPRTRHHSATSTASLPLWLQDRGMYADRTAKPAASRISSDRCYEPARRRETVRNRGFEQLVLKHHVSWLHVCQIDAHPLKCEHHDTHRFPPLVPKLFAFVCFPFFHHVRRIMRSLVQIGPGKIQNKWRANDFHFQNPQRVVTVDKLYSASVQLVLHVNGQDHALAKVGPNRIYVRTPINLPPCEGVLSINIDGHLTQQNIRLPEGAVSDSPSIATSQSEVRGGNWSAV